MITSFAQSLSICLGKRPAGRPPLLSRARRPCPFRALPQFVKERLGWISTRPPAVFGRQARERSFASLARPGGDAFLFSPKAGKEGGSEPRSVPEDQVRLAPAFPALRSAPHCSLPGGRLSPEPLTHLGRVEGAEEEEEEGGQSRTPPWCWYR